jgi:hypothetical protein
MRLLALILALVISASHVHAEKRLTFVIANSAYKNAGPLQNPKMMQLTCPRP